MDQVEQTKWIASLVLFLITMVCGYLPVKFLLNQRYVQHAMFAGGGVLMATAFCHLIPEAHDSFKLAQAGRSANATAGPSANSTAPPPPTASETPAGDSEGGLFGGPLGEQLLAQLSGLDVPYLEMTLCCGFFFMLVVEQLMLKFINNHTHEHPCDAASDESSYAGQLVVCHMAPLPDGPDNLAAGAGGSANTNGGSLGNLSTAAINPRPSAGGAGERRLGGPGGGAGAAATELYKFLRGLLIVSAFGAHSIFDGVAIGSQETVDKVWTIFVAISCHKLIIAAVVGLELYAATLESNLWTLVHLSIFSIMSPIGIILVVVAQNSLHINSDHPGMILLQSFATGTLLYIIFIEILNSEHEAKDKRGKLGKSFSLMAGFALMLLVLTLVGEG